MAGPDTHGGAEWLSGGEGGPGLQLGAALWPALTPLFQDLFGERCLPAGGRVIGDCTRELSWGWPGTVNRGNTQEDYSLLKHLCIGEGMAWKGTSSGDRRYLGSSLSSAHCRLGDLGRVSPTLCPSVCLSVRWAHGGD